MNTIDRHLKEFGNEPQAMAKVPGAFVLFGSFASCYGGSSISAADNRFLTVKASFSSSHQTVIFNSNTSDKKKISMSSLKFRPEDRWANFVRGTIYELSKINKALPPLEISLEGTLLKAIDNVLCPAVAIGVSLVVSKMCNFDLNAEKLVSIAAGSSTFCLLDYNLSVLYSMALAKENYWLCYNFSSNQYNFLQNPFANGSYSMMEIDCGISYETTKEEISNAIENSKLSMNAISRIFGKRPFNSISQTELSDRGINIGENERQWAKNLAEEYSIAKQAVNAFEKANTEQIGSLLARNGRLLREEFEITCPEVDWMAKRTGLSSVINNGNGPVVYSICNNDKIDSLNEILSEYEHIFGFRAKTQLFVPACAKQN